MSGRQSRRRTIWAVAFAVAAFLLLFNLLFYPNRLRGITGQTSGQRRIRLLENNLRDLAEYWNAHSTLRNDDVLPPLEPDYIPIVIYVYERAHLLRQVVEHLRNATDIEKTVLIVSHDGFVPDVIQVVDAIDFVRVRQLIHPSPPKVKADIFTLKKHWWWMMETVWESVPEVPRDRPVLFIEEDHALAPDFYQVLKAMWRYSMRYGREDMWGLSLFQPIDSDDNFPDTFDWIAGHSNTAYAFNATVWRMLSERRGYFMNFHDGWDWAVYSLMQHRWLPDTYLAPRLSRVRNIGRLGVTVREDDYDRRGFGKMPVSQRRTFTAVGEQDRLQVRDWLFGAYPYRLPLYTPRGQFDPR